MPLKKACSIKAFRTNLSKERKRGKSLKQALAIAYKQLHKSCHVSLKKKLTPKQIVAKRRGRK